MLRLRNLFSTMLLLLPGTILLTASGAKAADYRKATEGQDVVMGKLYPKSERIELGLPELGFVMNQSYVSTLLVGGSATYFMSESLGFSANFTTAINNDKPERTCIENFYFDPSNEVGVACGEVGLLKNTDANNDGFPRYGPAYVPIRELQQVLMANVVWSPVYGKQLLFLSGTSYFDLFFELGFGFATSTFYQKADRLKNGNKPRDKYIDPNDPINDKEAANASNAKIGALPEQTKFYGIDGRPTAKTDNNPVLNLGLGQKFHFGRLFHFKVFVRNMTLLGTDKQFENLLAIYGGVGLRF